MKKNLCPRCQSADLHRSRTRGLADALHRLFNRRPYRCAACNHRFYAPHRRRPHPNPHTRRDLLYYLALAALVALGVHYFTTREPPPPDL